MDQKQIKFGIELPKDLHHKVKVEAATRGLKMKEASKQAFAAWVGESSVGSLKPSEIDLIAAAARMDAEFSTATLNLAKEILERNKVARPSEKESPASQKLLAKRRKRV